MRAALTGVFNGDPFGPLAMILCGLGQARKGAAAAKDSCAVMWLEGLPPKIHSDFWSRNFFALSMASATFISIC